MQYSILLKKIDKGSSRIRKTLESWHNASINHADTIQGRSLISTLLNKNSFIDTSFFHVNVFLLSYLLLQIFVADILIFYPSKAVSDSRFSVAQLVDYKSCTLIRYATRALLVIGIE